MNLEFEHLINICTHSAHTVCEELRLIRSPSRNAFPPTGRICHNFLKAIDRFRPKSDRLIPVNEKQKNFRSIEKIYQRS